MTADQIEISQMSWYKLSCHNTLLTVNESPLEKSNITKKKMLFPAQWKGTSPQALEHLINYCKRQDREFSGFLEMWSFWGQLGFACLLSVWGYGLIISVWTLWGEARFTLVHLPPGFKFLAGLGSSGPSFRVLVIELGTHDLGCRWWKQTFPGFRQHWTGFGHIISCPAA